MNTLNFNIDPTDLKVLYVKTKHAYGNVSFETWTQKVKKAYYDFASQKENPKSFSDWVNGQIIYLN